MILSFIKLDINIMNDTKIKLIRKMPDGDGLFVLWIGLLCLAMKSGRPGIVEIGDQIPFTDESLSCEFDIPINTIRLGLETFKKFKMIDILQNGSIFITNFEKHQELEKIEKAKEVSRESSRRYRQKLLGSDGHSSSRDGHVMMSDDTDKDKDLDKESEKENTPLPPSGESEKPKQKRERFNPPSIEEISNYCKERNNGINPNSFHDFYSSKGWLIGKNKMKDWKAAVRTWENKHRDQHQKLPSTGSRITDQNIKAGMEFLNDQRR